MKKIHAVIFAMLAMFALGATMAATASAEETLLAEWLLNGNPVVELISTTTSGLILLEDEKTLIGKAAVLCSGILVGSVGPNGEDETTEVLTLTEKEVKELGGVGLLGEGLGPDCVEETGCAEGTAASPIEVWPLGLPWLTELFLMADGKFLVLLTSMDAADGSLVGYELLCLILGVNSEDGCTSADFEFEVFNDADTGDAAIPAGAQSTPKALCTQSNEESGVNQADELAEILPLMGLLTVSSV